MLKTNINRIVLCLLSGIFLTACETPTIKNGDKPNTKPTTQSAAQKITQDLQTLFEQKRIDPLTHYIKKHQTNTAYATAVQRLKQERTARCQAVADIYRIRPKTTIYLKRIKDNYAYSCPEMVQAFAKKVTKNPNKAAEEKAAPQLATLPQRTVVGEQAPAEISGSNTHSKEVTGKDPVVTASSDAISQTDTQAYERYLRNTLAVCNQAIKQRQYASALQVCTPLAERGDAKVQNYLGTVYLSASGYRDKQQAVYWFKRAAEQGYAEGQFNLGARYVHGQGIEKDLNQAIKWFRRAAKQGTQRAQYNLGLMYSKGQGATQNDEEAFVWFSLAVMQGSRDALIQRDRLLKRLTPDQVEIAQSRTKNIAAQYSQTPDKTK